ncbi:MAG TPA: carbon starvation protein A [Candidatus Omnitrophota bacterium]|nr:carbon starvation protein A [Candidatus Omnitrophota bacterium]
MNALPIIVTTLCLFTLAYRYYSAFLASKVLALDGSRQTPAYRLRDGQNYYPMSKWVLFGHHFAAIAGAGPLIGPVLAAQFGYFPGLLWMVVGTVLGGAVHDFVILVFSVRREGKSLAEIVKTEFGPVAGVACAIAILFIIIVALAGLGFVVVNALAESSWGTFAIAASIPIAMLMGVYTYAWRKGAHAAVRTASIAGVTALFLAVIFGKQIPEIPFLHAIFLLDRHQIVIAMMVYGFFASVLPVWLLLAPRDYLSSYMKLGTVLILIAGIIYVNPRLEFPPLSCFVNGGGPIIPGKAWPFCCITIMCGAISGFHALVSSGTTPKMMENELEARPIGYGAMLVEALVSIVCLIAVSAMHPGDYYAINVSPEIYAKVSGMLGIAPVHLDALTRAVGEETLVGRTGGAVSLAVGMAQIFSAIPGLTGLMKYWYHFAIMFEALFILTTVDAGTRIARFILQELLGNVWKPFKRTDWLPGNVLASFLIVLAWGYMIWNSSISTIWPMFGIANQLLAGIALAVGSAMLVKTGKARYVWVTALPFVFVTVTTLAAAYQMMAHHYWPKSATPFIVRLNTILIFLMVGCSFVVFFGAFRGLFRPDGRKTLRTGESRP